VFAGTAGPCLAAFGLSRSVSELSVPYLTSISIETATGRAFVSKDIMVSSSSMVSSQFFIGGKFSPVEASIGSVDIKYLAFITILVSINPAGIIPAETDLFKIKKE